MNTINLENALKIWQETFTISNQHITDERLYTLSQSGGLEDASDIELEHLSRCPECLESWSIVCMLDEFNLKEPPNQTVFISSGYLKAAASAKQTKEPLNLKSECGKFIIGVFPDLQKPGKGMITLDTVGHLPDLEKMRATVSDAKGMVALEKSIIGGRAAAVTSDMDQLDFSKYTILLTKNLDSQNDD
ncbi:MAG: hypothetical protein V6Z89_20750 [Desulfobacter sp.]